MCLVFSPEKRETHKQFDPHPFPGQSREVVYVYWFFLPTLSEAIFFQSPPKRAGKRVPRDNCQKVSKIFLTLFDDF